MSPLQRTGPIKTRVKPCRNGCGGTAKRRGLCTSCAWDEERAVAEAERVAEREAAEAERIAAALAAPPPVVREHATDRPEGHRPVETVRARTLESEPRTDWAWLTAVLTNRCAGLCEACGLSLGSGLETKPDRHHRQRRAVGGDLVVNLVMLHHSCHVVAPQAVHQRPAWAMERGLIVPTTMDPATAPLLVPSKGWVTLTPEGAYAPL